MSGLPGRRFRKLLSQTQVYYLIVGLSMVCSVVVFFLAVHSGSKEDAVRGGAIPVLVSFLLIYLRRNYGEGVYEAVLQLYPDIAKKIEAYSKDGNAASFSPVETTQLVLGILSRINVEAGEQKKQNIALFVSSVFGTLVLAFGDFFYKLFKG
jgi:hypothetical protein